MKAKTILNVVGITALLTCGAGAGLFNYVHQRDSSALKTKVSQFSKNNPALENAQKFAALAKQKIHIFSYDHLKLTGWLTLAQPNFGTILIVHGFGVDHHSLDKIGAVFNQLGYNVLQPDNRAAGQSAGHYLSYGFQEKYDVQSWLQYLQTRSELAQNFYLFGASMGAATVLESLALDLPATLQGVIADSSYTDAFAISEYTISRQFNLPAHLITQILSFWSKIIVHGSYRQASPLNSVAQAAVPLLFICGLKDTTVPPAMSKELYAAALQPKFIEYFPKGEHIRSIEADPRRYYQIIQQFLQFCQKQD